jgi:hypothetical protein
LLKGGIGGVYHSVSTKHLQSYLDEYVFRYNHRDLEGRGMFDAFTSRIEKAASVLLRRLVQQTRKLVLPRYGNLELRLLGLL